jgi:N utilization substance protein B
MSNPTPPKPPPPPRPPSGKGRPEGKSLGRPRTGARLAAVQALFQSEQNAEPAEAVIQQFVRHRLGSQPGEGGLEEGRVPEADLPLFTLLVRGVATHAEEIDGIVSPHLARDWPLEKLDPVLRALLRCAALELWQAKDPPARVVINEYLDVAHGFFGQDTARFANGVMDTLARHLRAPEFAR